MTWHLIPVSRSDTVGDKRGQSLEIALSVVSVTAPGFLVRGDTNLNEFILFFENLNKIIEKLVGCKDALDPPLNFAITKFGKI